MNNKEVEFKVSDKFINRLRDLYNKAPAERRIIMINPDKIAKDDPFWYLTESVGKVCDFLTNNKKDRNVLYENATLLVYAGKNPFKEKDLEKSGVAPEEFKAAMKKLKKRGNGV